jgi:hypothetical protein
MSASLSETDFSTVFRDDFNGGSLDNSKWRNIYSGEYHNNAFAWNGGQLAVGDGLLTIETEETGDGWLSGGLSTIPEGQTYGSYEFRARVDEGQGTSAVFLLWPSDGSWTDEVDILETHEGDRSSFAFTNHGTPLTTEYIDVDVSQWHTYKLDWVPGLLRLSVDGEVKAEITEDVPSQKMSFGMQGQVHADGETWFGGAPDGSTPSQVGIEVDWVDISSWNGTTSGSGGEGEAVATDDTPEEDTTDTSAQQAADDDTADGSTQQAAADDTSDTSWQQAADDTSGTSDQQASADGDDTAEQQASADGEDTSWQQTAAAGADSSDQQAATGEEDTSWQQASDDSESATWQQEHAQDTDAQEWAGDWQAQQQTQDGWA